MRKLALLMLPLLLAMTACSGDAKSELDLDGKTYHSQQVSGYTLAEGTTMTLTFSGGQVSVNAGCNTIFGAASFKGNTLKVEHLAMTEMGCEESLMEQDQFVADFLGSSPEFTQDGTTLTVAGDGVEIVFEEETDLELTSTRWVLDGIEQNMGVSSIPGEADASLVFSSDEVAAHFGCNTGGGAVVIGETTIEFDALFSTRMACPEPVMEVEGTVSQVLTGETTYEIDGRKLRITNGDITLHYRGEV